MTTFYENYVALCALNKKSPSAVATEIGLSRTSPNGWKKGKMPSDVNLTKLAIYFGVTASQLTDPNFSVSNLYGTELSYEKFEKLCKELNVHPSGVAAEIGLQEIHLTKWKEGKGKPGQDLLLKISKKFHVPVSYFSESPEKEKSPATNEGDKALEEFNLLFSQLSPEQQERELAYLRSLLADANK